MEMAGEHVCVCILYVFECVCVRACVCVSVCWHTKRGKDW